MARKVLGSLKMLLKDAQRRGQVAQNVAANARIEIGKRGQRRLKAGADFPLPQEVARIVNAAPDGKAKALLMVLAHAGLRASEARGLALGKRHVPKGWFGLAHHRAAGGQVRPDRRA